jgi:hypothetical protein
VRLPSKRWASRIESVRAVLPTARSLGASIVLAPAEASAASTAGLPLMARIQEVTGTASFSSARAPRSVAGGGATVGVAVGPGVGAPVGAAVGALGDCVGLAVGTAVGAPVGDTVGTAVGGGVGPAVGATVVGTSVGKAVGAAVGAPVGSAVGAAVGCAVGDCVGAGPHAPQCAGHSRTWSVVHGGETDASHRSESTTPWHCSRVGLAVGAEVGGAVGASVGRPLGAPVGTTVGASLGSAVGSADGERVGKLDGVALGPRDGDAVGVALGDAVGVALGTAVGEVDGAAVGLVVGRADGARLGTAVGGAVGVGVGTRVGVAVGAPVGVDDGAALGASVGTAVGTTDGTAVGAAVGSSVGAALGANVGLTVGTAVGAVGAVVGAGVGAPVGASVGIADGAAVGPQVKHRAGHATEAEPQSASERQNGGSACPPHSKQVRHVAGQVCCFSGAAQSASVQSATLSCTPRQNPIVGADEGAAVGDRVGAPVGTAVGGRVGPAVGVAVGPTVGLALGHTSHLAGHTSSTPFPGMHRIDDRRQKLPSKTPWQWKHVPQVPGHASRCASVLQSTAAAEHVVAGSSTPRHDPVLGDGVGDGAAHDGGRTHTSAAIASIHGVVCRRIVDRSTRGPACGAAASPPISRQRGEGLPIIAWFNKLATPSV